MVKKETRDLLVWGWPIKKVCKTNVKTYVCLLGKCQWLFSKILLELVEVRLCFGLRSNGPQTLFVPQIMLQNLALILQTDPQRRPNIKKCFHRRVANISKILTGCNYD